MGEPIRDRAELEAMREHAEAQYGSLTRVDRSRYLRLLATIDALVAEVVEQRAALAEAADFIRHNKALAMPSEIGFALRRPSLGAALARKETHG